MNQVVNILAVMVLSSCLLIPLSMAIRRIQFSQLCQKPSSDVLVGLRLLFVVTMATGALLHLGLSVVTGISFPLVMQLGFLFGVIYYWLRLLELLRHHA